MSATNLAKCTLGISCLRKCFIPHISSVRAISHSNVMKKQQQNMLSKVESLKEKEEIDILQVNTKAAKSYLEKVQAHEKFMQEKMAEFSIGKRHLANMMGEDPDTFTQEDINRSIQYLFPSSLYEKKALPHMLPPEEVYPNKKEAQYDHSGRPYHVLFYTGQPQYYQAMNNIARTMLQLEKHEDSVIKKLLHVEVVDRVNLGGSVWISKTKLEKLFLENLKDHQYDKFIMSMDRVSSHPYSDTAKEFIMQYRQKLELKTSASEIPPLMTGEDGRPYMTAVGTRKMAKCIVKVVGGGNGYFNINGQPISYFKEAHIREQVIMPLFACNMLRKVDVICRAERGGQNGQAGAMRYAIATALCSFVDAETVERMRVGGLLTLDTRRRERKKPGQKGARAKFFWRKR